MTNYRVFLVSQILFIGTSLAVPADVTETATSTAATSPVPSVVPSSSVLPEGISVSTVTAAVELLQRANDYKEAISIGNGTIPLEDGDTVPDEGWEYENMTYVDTRRILYSKTVGKGKRPYMVYLQLTKESAKAHKYRGWLCGGVIVDKYYVLTSAACVEDADRFYIVSGTTRFIDSFDYKTNECTCKHRRKVIWKCIPKNYKFDFQDSIKWSSNDIAIVKVDRPFKLGVLEKGCEFPTDLICINNVSRELEKPGTKGFIAGWGSGSNFREGVYRRQKGPVHIPQNAKCLQEAKVCIMDSEQCQKRWAQRFREIIKNYMICTKDVMKRLSELCEKKYANCTDVEYGNKQSRRSAEQFEEPTNEVSTLWNVDLGRHLRDPDDYTARRTSTHGGFCENDHGGPLIVKYQGKERVIGVISACKIDPKSHSCHGPFLYTSIFRNRQFISCAINKDVQENCRRVFRTGVTHEEWQVSWDGFKEDDELNMKADSKKDENEFNSDEIEFSKPSLRQNEEVVEDNVKNDFNSEEIKVNRPVEMKVEKDEKEEEEKETEQKHPNRQNEEAMEDNAKDYLSSEEIKVNRPEKDEKKEEKEETEEINPQKEKKERKLKRKHKKSKKKPKRKVKKAEKREEVKVEAEDDAEMKNKDVEVESEVDAKLKKKRLTVESQDEAKVIRQQVETQSEEKTKVNKKQQETESEDEPEMKKKQVEAEAEDEVELKNKQVEADSDDEAEVKKTQVVAEKEDQTEVEVKKKETEVETEDDGELKKKQVKVESETKEVEVVAEYSAEIEKEVKSTEKTRTKSVSEVTEKKTVVESENEDVANNAEDKAEVFYESSRDENVNDPSEIQ